MLGKFSQFKTQASQRVLQLKENAQKKWEEMQEAPDNIPDHWEEHTDDNGNKFYIDTNNGEMYRMNKRQHKRIDTIEKISLVEQMSKSPTSPINEAASREPWKCPSCTLENPGQATHCAACDTERPPEVEPKTPSNLKSGHNPDIPVASPSESNHHNDNNNNNNNDNEMDNGNEESMDHKNDEDEKNEELSPNDLSFMRGNSNLAVPNGHGNNNYSNGNDNGNNNDDDDDDDNNDNRQMKSSHSPMSTMEQINAAINDSLKTMGNADIDGLEEHERSILLQFVEYTDATPDVGLKFLTRTGWDVQKALALYFDENPNPSKSRQASQAFGVDDITKILDADAAQIADDDDLIASGDRNRSSMDLDQAGIDPNVVTEDNNEKDDTSDEEEANEDNGHNRLTTAENIHVAQIASLQQAEFDKETEELRKTNDRLTIENKHLREENDHLHQERETLQTELQDREDEIESLRQQLETSKRREDELQAINNQHVEERQRFQKDWDRMNSTFGMIVDELNKTTNALRRGDETQMQLNKLDELIQQVENLRSPGNENGQENESGDQKGPSHGRTQSRSYEIYHKQKSSDPTYDRQKPAHTRSEHSRGPSFTLAKDIFNGDEENEDNEEPNNQDNNNNNNNNNKQNNNNNGNDSDDDQGMRRDSIAKSENDEEMIAVIAYYDIGGGDDDDDDNGIHSRDSSWFGDYGKLPTSRRVSQRTPQTVNTVKDLFDDGNNMLENVNSNNVARGVAGNGNNNNNNNSNANNNNNNSNGQSNYNAMKQYGHGKRTSQGRASHGVNIQPTIPETTEETEPSISTVRDLFDSDNNNNNNHNNKNNNNNSNNNENNNNNNNSKHNKDESYSQVRALFPNESSSESDEEDDTRKERTQRQNKNNNNDPNFNASNLTPISTDSNRPSKGQKLGDIFNEVGAPNFEELEKSHLTPVSVHASLVTGLHGINVNDQDGPNEEKQRSRSDEEVEKELRDKIRSEMEGEFIARENELKDKLKEEILTEMKPQIEGETRKLVEKESELRIAKEKDSLRSELHQTFEVQLKALREEMKESEAVHQQEVKSLENTKLDLIRSTSQEIESLRSIIKKYFSKSTRKGSDSNDQSMKNMPQMLQMFFK